MIVECPKCKEELEFNSVCSKCNNIISLFPRIAFFGDKEEHLVITLTSIFGIISGGFFGFFISGNFSPMVTFITTIVCANVAIIFGFLVGKTTMLLFNAIKSQGPYLQYGSFLFIGGLHGLFYTTMLYKSSGWKISSLNLILGMIIGAIFILTIIFYIRKNQKKMNNLW